VLPLHYGKLCLGYCVIAPQNPRKEQRLIQHLVLNIGNAIGNIREYDIMHSMLAKMSEIWIHDELTNIYNRAGFWQKVKGFVAKTKENDGKIVIFFMDLDGLKKINDEYGHDEGDLYIKSMAQILKSCNTGSGVISRYGGDEFVVLENYDTDDDIKLYLDRLKNEVENFNKAEMFAHKLSVSIGYQREDDFETLDIRKMIEKADKEMYNCKRNKLKN
jgi:diguanylate cyclase (GGDEF)-like protein